MTAIDFSAFEVLTFDCYGTLIDWEGGLLAALRPILTAHGACPDDDEVLEAYARCESALEAGPYMPYRTILGEALRAVADRFGFTPSADEVTHFAASPEAWPAFGDSADALRQLHEHYRLGVITNCDDDLFAFANRKLHEPFDWIVTAQQARAYKPDPRVFEVALERIGIPPTRILHLAQSLYHDHVPAKRLGLTTVWIDRRHMAAGFGAPPQASADPDLTLPDMRSLAALTMENSHGR